MGAMLGHYDEPTCETEPRDPRAEKVWMDTLVSGGSASVNIASDIKRVPCDDVERRPVPLCTQRPTYSWP